MMVMTAFVSLVLISDASIGKTQLQCAVDAAAR